MGDPTPSRDGGAYFADEIKKLWTAIGDLRSPSGTQRYNSVQVLERAVSDLQDTVDSLAARVAVSASAATFNTGNLPDDSTFHNYGSTMPITVDVPTGKLIVTVGCGQATVSPSGGSIVAEATFQIPGVTAYGDVSSRAYSTSGVLLGMPLAVSQAFTVTPGTYTITGIMRAWAAGSSTASANFRAPYITVQVTG